MTHSYWAMTLLGLSLVGIGVGIFQKKSGVHKIGLAGICVDGLQRTSPQAVLSAVGLKKGDSLWKESLTAIKHRLEDLPWVKTVVLRREMPHILRIHLTERTPMAIWQHQGKKIIIDEAGLPIKGISPQFYDHLMVITGLQAPQHFSELAVKLRPLRKKIPFKGACFLRSQRWDLYLEKGLRVQLPEENLEKALVHLIALWPLVGSGTCVDLRFADALILHPPLSPPGSQSGAGGAPS